MTKLFQAFSGLFESDFSEKFLETRVGAERVQGRVNLEDIHPLVMLLITSLEPFEGLVLLSQYCVDGREAFAIH